MPRTVSGEARVTYVTNRYAILSKAGLNGTVFVVPSSVLGQQHGYPSLKALLNLNDVVKFTAEAQEERNGVKWVAQDGSVKRVREARQIQGLGTVTRVDESYGQFGFVQSELGNVFFNANVVRPETNDATKVLKKGQTVRFTAVDQPDNKCPWRATMVCAKNYKAATETKTNSKPTTSNPDFSTNNVELNRPPSSASSSIPNGWAWPLVDSMAAVDISSRDSSPPSTPTDSMPMWPTTSLSDGEKARPLDALIARPSAQRRDLTLSSLREPCQNQHKESTVSDICSTFVRAVTDENSFETEGLRLRDYAHKLLRISADQCPVCAQL